MASFGVVLRSRPTSIDGILMVVDERQDAEEIAVELRRRGQQVDVREMSETVPPLGNPETLEISGA